MAEMGGKRTFARYSRAMITSAAEFGRLRNSERPEEYKRAAHSEAPEAVWLEVVSCHPDMRSWVAHNKTVPLSILRLLATDQDPHVRGTVATKRKLDAEMFERLAQDVDESVRHRVANNAKAPRHVLEELSRDPAPFIAQAASRRLQG
jgi:hypothetical protein